MNRKRAQGLSLRVPIVLMLIAAAVFFGWRLLADRGETSGAAAFEAGDFERAALLFQRTAATDPAARYYHGVSQRHRRVHNDAVEAFTVLRPLPEYETRAWYQLVRTLIEADRLGDARAEVESMPRRLESEPLAWEAAGLYHLAAGAADANRALDALRTMVGVSTAWLEGRVQRVVYASARDFPTEIERLRDLIGGQAEVGALGQIETILERAHDEHLAAIQGFERAVALADENPEAIAPARSYFELAAIEEIRRRDPAAEQRRRQVLDVSKDDVGGDLDLQRELTRLHAKSVEYLAESLIAAGRPAEALQVIERMPVNARGDREYVYERLEAEARADIGDDERMLAIVDKWLKRDGDLEAMNFLRGRHERDAGDLERAAYHLEKANARSGARRNKEVLASVYMTVGDYDRANALWKELIERFPNEWELHLARARALEGMGWFEEARAELARQLRGRFAGRSTPGNAELRTYMDELLAKHRLMPDDLHKARQLYSTDPGNMLAATRYLGFLIDENNWTDAQRLAAELEKRMPENDPQAFDLAVQCGRLALHRGEIGRAVACFSEAVARRPWEPDGFAGLARAELEAGRVGSAASHLDRLDALAPRHAVLPRLRFDVHRAAGDVEGVLAGGRAMLESGAADWSIQVATAEAAVATGALDQARAILSELRTADAPGVDDVLLLHDLLVEVGDEDRADKRLTELVEKHRGQAGVLMRAAEALARRGRDELLRQTFVPIVARDPITHAPIAVMLAESAVARDQDVAALELLGLIRGVDRRAVYRLTAELCEKRGAFDEVRSILAAARRDDAESNELLRIGARVALERGDLTEAKKLVDRLARDAGMPRADLVALRARLLDASGSVVASQEALHEALDDPNTTTSERERLRLVQIDLLGARGQSQAVIEVVRDAIERGDDAAGPAIRACDHLVAAGVPNAAELVARTIENHGEHPALLWLRALVKAEGGDWEGAFADFRRARRQRDAFRFAHGLAIAAAATGKRADLNRAHELEAGATITRQVDASRAQAEFVFALRGRRPQDAPALADRLQPGNALIGRDLARMVERALNEPAALEALGKELPLYFLGLDERRAQGAALRALDRLEQALPDEKRVLTLLRAAALMNDSRSWSRGVALVGGILGSSQMSDDTALVVYLQSYVAGGQTEAMGRLVDYAIEAGVFDARAARVAARILIDAGRAEDAARLMHLSPERTPEKTLLEAMALHQAGNVKRAGDLIASAGPELRGSPEALQILAEAKALDPRTRPEALELATRAVYGDQAVDDAAMLALARIAFQNGRDAEAWKNLFRYVDSRPASALRVARAIAVIDAAQPLDVERRERLHERLLLLDPAQTAVPAAARNP